MRAAISIRRIAAEDVIAKLFADFSSDFIWDLISLYLYVAWAPPDSTFSVSFSLKTVQAGRAVIEFLLTGAVGRFIWTFQNIGGGTRIT